MGLGYNPRYPSVEDLRKRAKRRIPRFAFDYLDGGCNEEINLIKNTDELRKVELLPTYIKQYDGVDMGVKLWEKEYSAPFGIAPVGLQGLIWPRAPQILAKAAYNHKIPFVLSTVSTATIEEIADITQGEAWFQLYHPVEDELRDRLLKRAEDAGYDVLVILADVPSFGYRNKEIKNGLSMPPRMTFSNVCQILGKPKWAFTTLIHGLPRFQTLLPYIPRGLNLHHLGLFMNQTFNGRLNDEKLKRLRDVWKRKLVLKGLANPADVEKCIEIGLDGIIISNHGGRQLDAGPSSIKALQEIVPHYKGKIRIMMDSGIRSGPDIARALACGAEFVFLGRTFMYGVAALGKKGGEHTIGILKRQLQQIMEQLGCERVEDLLNCKIDVH
ncbi:L-lactate dehydrogenase (cytochrome) [Thermoflavifilum aggregans]|uniref:L-lactate dehydrogenase (Cytochrome) n=1 Tax=Thermoflavifilum aggregans TaxID=454188 RepID=A0A2M9CW26_9BACT|nr:alpha-hydroxy acid oxidase [Thermoflavifilum aggregans]PJJ76094.1 L-lactate dehydrogenase (cytochrome) [Thermoflavifilum aggregans]